MCGRYTIVTDIDDFLEQLGIPFPEELAHPRRYNVAPSQAVLALVADPTPRIELMEWGFVPSWAKPDRKMHAVINARADSVAEGKPYFRGAFRSGRCAILADGFYEWKKVGSQKQPYRITLDSGGLFAMAGLWSWVNTGDGSEHATCAIITVDANEMMAPIHDRMPAIMHVPDVPVWLDPKSKERDLLAILEPYPSDELRAYEVSRAVNSPANDTEQCIEPV